MIWKRISSIAVVLAALGWSQRAHAGGNEYAGAGPRGLARAGAVMAKPEDPMVMFYNPAGLAELRGAQLLAGFNAGYFNGCMDPVGYYGWGASQGGTQARLPDPQTGEPVLIDVATDPEYYLDPLDTVCNRQRMQPVPQLGLTWRATERLGLGFGLIYPGVVPPGTYEGNEQGLIVGDEGDPRPSPGRYMLREYNTTAFFPTLSAGFRVTDWFRIGASFQWGIILADAETVTPAAAGTNPLTDNLLRVEATDYFVPMGIFSMHFVPIEALDIVGMFRIQDQFKASGEATLTTGLYSPGLRPTVNKIDMAEVNQKLPWKAGIGIRYADRIRPRPEGTGAGEADRGNLHDPMADENWDIELDVVYEMNSLNDQQSIRAVDTCRDEMGVRMGCQTFERVLATTGRVITANYPTDTKTVVKNWQDQFSVRLGGSYNILPGTFSVSAGAHYENRGIDPSHMQLDFWPVQRLGLHTGIVLRLANRVDIILSYAHIFQETIRVAAPQHDPEGTGFNRTVAHGECFEGNCPVDPVDPVQNPDATAAHRQNIASPDLGKRWITNAGTYSSNMDLFALGLNFHF